MKGNFNTGCRLKDYFMHGGSCEAAVERVAVCCGAASSANPSNSHAARMSNFPTKIQYRTLSSDIFI
jgi:hypothetical protein